MIRSFLVFIACSVLMSAVASDDAARTAASAAPDAAAIIKQMGNAYATCRSYRDTGTSVTKFASDHPFEQKVEFKTAFRKPVDFRFEYISRNHIMEDKMIIHRDKDGTSMWWSIGGKQKKTTIEDAIASATGVSSGTAFNIPSMLFPGEVGGWSFLSKQQWQAMPDAQESGRECYCLTRKRENGDFENVWIDKVTFLLIRVDERSTIDAQKGKDKQFVTEQTVLYRPELNLKINDGDLQFNAPQNTNSNKGTGLLQSLKSLF